MSIPRDIILKVVSEERDYQIERGFDEKHEEDHAIWDFLMHIEDQLRQAKYSVNTRFEVLEKVRNLTALGVATMEKFGYVRRYDGEHCPSTELWK